MGSNSGRQAGERIVKITTTDGRVLARRRVAGDDHLAVRGESHRHVRVGLPGQYDAQGVGGATLGDIRAAPGLGDADTTRAGRIGLGNNGGSRAGARRVLEVGTLGGYSGLCHGFERFFPRYP